MVQCRGINYNGTRCGVTDTWKSSSTGGARFLLEEYCIRHRSGCYLESVMDPGEVSALVFFDLETCSFDTKSSSPISVDPETQRIIEIAAVLVPISIVSGEMRLDFSHRRTFTRLVYPGAAFDDEGHVSGITNMELVGKPHFNAVVDDFIAFVTSSPRPVMVAHNGNKFDIPVLFWELKRAGKRAVEQDVGCRASVLKWFSWLRGCVIVDTLDVLSDVVPSMKCRRMDCIKWRLLHGHIRERELLEQSGHRALVDCEVLAVICEVLQDGTGSSGDVSIEDGSFWKSIIKNMKRCYTQHKCWEGL